MPARTLAVGAAIVVVLYLAWLGWRDVLTAPPLPTAEPAASLADSSGAATVIEAAPSPWRVPPAAGVPSALRSSAGDAYESGAAPATADVSRFGSQPPLAPRIEPVASPDATRSLEWRPAGAPDGGEPTSTVDPEETRDRTRSRLALGGWVRDGDGHPVDGLPVQARPRRLFASLDGGTETAAVAEHRGVTDAAGRFAFEQIPDGDYELRTDETELYEKTMALVRAGVDSAVLVVEAKTGRSLFVHGVVESARGGPLPGVRVELVGQPKLAALSDEKGGYGLRLPVRARLQDAALRFARNGYRELRLPIGAGETPDAADVVHDVRLEPAGLLASVSGLVAGSDGRPVSRASVQLYSAGRGRRYQSVSDARGRFLLTGVEESDDYRLWVHPARGYRDHTREGVEVRGQGAVLDVTLEPLGTASLRGSMVDPEGRALPGFTLWLRPAYGASGPTAVTGDAQGRFVTGDLPEGPVALETRAAPQLAVTGIALAAGIPREVVLPLDVGSYRIEGTLRAENGAPVGGARLSLHWSRADGGLASRSLRETTSDSTGSFLFTQLGAGVHALSATAAGFRSVRVDQPVGPGTPPLEIKLAASP